MMEAVNGVTPTAREMLGEIWSYAELTRAAVQAAEDGAHEWGNGCGCPTRGRSGLYAACCRCGSRA
jgi:aromatic ring hydroxylase